MRVFTRAPKAGDQRVFLEAVHRSRRGHMTEAMRLVIGKSFRSLRLHRLEANIQPGNLASIALVRKLGFRLEGESPRYLKIGGRWRDHERWAILAEDWRPRESARSGRTGGDG